MTTDLEALKALVAAIKAPLPDDLKHAQSLIGRVTEGDTKLSLEELCETIHVMWRMHNEQAAILRKARAALPALERLLAGQQEIPEVTHYQGAKVKCTPHMRPIIDLESRDDKFDYFLVRAEVKAAPLPSDKLRGLVRKWRRAAENGLPTFGHSAGTKLCADELEALLSQEPSSGATRHVWDRDGERCVNCGQKDWMAGSECRGKNDSI